MQPITTEDMMSTRTWYRDVARLLDEMGFSYTFEQGKKHTKVWIEKNGKKGMISISVSPSDRKALGNVKSDLRRFLG